MSTAIAGITAIALAACGVVYGTWAVGGSDSSCYGLMAKAFASGDLQPSSAIAIDAPWPDAQRTTAPGGFIPSPVRPDAASPICSPGMPVLMAPAAAMFGRDAIFWLVPLSGALLVWSAFLLARRLAGGAAGAAAAILTATSPIVLFQVVQPMNDVLAAALWLAAFAVRCSLSERSAFALRASADRTRLLTGTLTGLAILVRPNLAPLAIVVALGHPPRSTALILAAAVPGIAVTFWLNYELYGSAIATGYGDAGQLFSISNVDENWSNFGRAFLDTQYLVPLAGLMAPFVLSGEERRLAVRLLLGAVTVVAIYFLYQPYPEWWYLRFLIPALAFLFILTSAAGVALAAKLRMRGVVPVVAVLLAILGIRAAAAHQAFELQRLEGRYRDAAALVGERLPDNAVLITVWQSGSIRFHADREIVMWDSLDPAWLDRAVAWLQDQGRQPYFLFERREEPEFRARFRGHSAYGALDWPPRLDLNRQVRIYDPGDRARFLAGETYPTDNQPRRK
jgi:hypothetical protein